MFGGGQLFWEPGERTDDTAMAIPISRAAAAGHDLRGESGTAPGLVDSCPVEIRLRCKDVTMPKHYPPEFRRDVVAVARKHEAPLNQIAKDFGISESFLTNWLKKADIEVGVMPGVTEKESAELRDAKKRIGSERQIPAGAVARLAIQQICFVLLKATLLGRLVFVRTPTGSRDLSPWRLGVVLDCGRRPSRPSARDGYGR